jgi:riboflavin-specific deaminase-like protein
MKKTVWSIKVTPSRFLSAHCAAVLNDGAGHDSWTPVLETLKSEMRRDRKMIATVDLDGKEIRFVPPFVTLTFAQSIDGCIATADRRPVLISGQDSLRMTHALRAAHDTILVGVNTVNKDNPSLTVRMCNGTNPQPIVLDSHCSIKASSKLVTSPNCVRPIIAITSSKMKISEERRAVSPKQLESLGCRFLSCHHDASGRIDLTSLLYNLSLLKFSSIMVEGGASVIKSFLVSGENLFP